jgi:glyoxylase-like metal-dependent hydrolase (beta-lactamase superfamily II)
MELKRRQVLLAAGGISLAACQRETARAESTKEMHEELPNIPSKREFHHGAGFVAMIPAGAIRANCYVVGDTESRSALIIDPGGLADKVVAFAKAAKWKVEQILATHGHIDHVAAVSQVQELLKVPFAMHGDDREWLNRVEYISAQYGYSGAKSPKLDRKLRAGDELKLGKVTVKVLHTPGHSKGGCCFYIPDWKIVFTGDTLFRRSVGRTDLPGGSTSTLLTSIQSSLMSMDDEVVVYCGHEDTTTIGQEKRSNPYLR